MTVAFQGHYSRFVDMAPASVANRCELVASVF